MIAGIVAMLVYNPDGAINSMVGGANDAVSLALTLLASYSLWMGLFALVDKIGLGGVIARILRAPVNFLFPNSSPEAKKFVSGNIAANFLGLGNAATPMGISAASEMDDGSGIAGTDAIMLVVLSSTSLQLLPSTVIGLRAAKGSASPAAFLPACLVATVLSTLVGVTLVKLISFAKKRSARRVKRERKGLKRSRRQNGAAKDCLSDRRKNRERGQKT